MNGEQIDPYFKALLEIRADMVCINKNPSPIGNYFSSSETEALHILLIILVAQPNRNNIITDRRCIIDLYDHPNPPLATDNAPSTSSMLFQRLIWVLSFEIFVVVWPPFLSPPAKYCDTGFSSKEDFDRPLTFWLLVAWLYLSHKAATKTTITKNTELSLN